MPKEMQFDGKAVHVWVNSPAGGGLLQKVTLQYIGQKEFLVGEFVDSGGEIPDTREGLTMCFPIDDISMLTVYENVASARHEIARWRASPKPKRD